MISLHHTQARVLLVLVTLLRVTLIRAIRLRAIRLRAIPLRAFHPGLGKHHTLTTLLPHRGHTLSSLVIRDIQCLLNLVAEGRCTETLQKTQVTLVCSASRQLCCRNNDFLIDFF